jgi:hypothetical protein
MSDFKGKKLPTVEQVETIIEEFGTRSIADFAEHFGLEQLVVEAVVDCLRRLRRLPEGVESIVRCAGSKHRYV